MGITTFSDYAGDSSVEQTKQRKSGYLQSRYPLLVCNHSLKGVTEDNYGYCYGVTSDQIPFEADLWYEHNPETKNISIYRPEIMEFNDVEDEPLINESTGTRTFNYEVQRHYNMALCDGMVDNGSIESLSLLNTYVELLIDYGMIEYATNVYNASASRLVDFAGNDTVAITITLEEDGEVMSSTPLMFTPFIESRSGHPKLRIMEYVPEVYGYLAGDMDVGNFDGVLLYRLLQKKKLRYEEFHELCCTFLRLINSKTWVDAFSPVEMERAIELVTEQAVALMPLDVSDYDMINKFDKWQEEFCEEDNPRIDDAVNRIFLDGECRMSIQNEMWAGNYLELAEDIGLDTDI